MFVETSGSVQLCPECKAQWQSSAQCGTVHCNNTTHTEIIFFKYYEVTLLLFSEVVKMATLREQAKTSIPRVLRNSLSHGNNSLGKLHE